jgi:predicted phage terminase large subunit-like protein
VRVRERPLLDAMCRQDFASFCLKAFGIVYPGRVIQPNWHIEAICYALQQMLEGKSPNRLVLNLPPRSLKSFIVSVCWPAWLLGRDPGRQIIAASYSEDLGLKFSRECRMLMESKFYRDIFPTRISARKASEGEFETTRGGFRYVTSVNGTLTGRGCDVLIIDDPIKADDAESDTQRASAFGWLQNTALSRLNEPSKSLTIVVMQRLHEDDISGRLIAAGWPSIVIQAIAPEPMKYHISAEEIYRRNAGEVLQQGRMAEENYAQVKRDLGSRIFAAQYQQDPTPAEGNMVKREWLKRYETRPERFDRIVASVDPAAATGKNSDFTAVIIVGIKDRHLYLLHAEGAHWGIMEALDNINRLSREWRADLVIVENTSSGVSLIPLLIERTSMNVIGSNPSGKKKVRMARHQGRIEAGRLLLPIDAPWLADFEKELLSFPSGRYDDQVDALLQFLEWYSENEALLEPIGAVQFFVFSRNEPFFPESFRRSRIDL